MKRRLLFTRNTKVQQVPPVCRSSGVSAPSSGSSSSGAPIPKGAQVMPPAFSGPPVDAEALATQYQPVAAPKHFPFPPALPDGELAFEAFMFAFGCCTGLLQLIHMYRSVWWLPHSYTNQIANFYLMDENLIKFVVIVLGRRLVYICGRYLIDRVTTNRKILPFVLVTYRGILFVVIIMLLGFYAYQLMLKHPFVNIFYLCYPVIVYLILFGLKIAPFFKLTCWDNSSQMAIHACRSNATEIRREVDVLRANFNSRMKQILFSSTMVAYYAGFVPCCFAQSYVQYDIYWSSQHVVFIFLTSFVSYTTQILSPRFCDTLHRAALHLGTWLKLGNRTLLVPNCYWSQDALFPCGTVVRYGRNLYKACGGYNAAEPGNAGFSRFYAIFKNPSFPLGFMLFFHLTIVLFQLIILMYSSFWYHTITLTTLLTFNYYILFRVTRDYLLSHKLYAEEIVLQNKVNGK